MNTPSLRLEESNANLTSNFYINRDIPLDLQRVFPAARVYGCDINKKALAEAHKNCDTRGVTIFESQPDAIRLYQPFDVITCLNVLTRYPEVQDKGDISQIYPFADFEQAIEVLVSSLAESGVIAVYNSCYLVEQTSLAACLQPVKPNRHKANGWSDKYDRTGVRLTQSTATLHGQDYPIPAWRARLMEERDKIDDKRIFEMLDYRHARLPAATGPVDTQTTIWRKITVK